METFPHVNGDLNAAWGLREVGWERSKSHSGPRAEPQYGLWRSVKEVCFQMYIFDYIFIDIYITDKIFVVLYLSIPLQLHLLPLFYWFHESWRVSLVS